MPTILETIAVVFSMWSVMLTIRKQMWCWPTGIVGILAFGVVFAQTRLYSDMCLQVIFLVQSIYGWYYWKHPKFEQKEVEVTMLPPLYTVWMSLGSLASVILLGMVMQRWTNDPLPYWDAAIAVLSIVAQMLLSRKVFETWAIWIVVDVISINVYLLKGLYLTAAEYMIFLLLAIVGYVTWHRSLHEAI